jgi:beta-glucuronidase
MKRFHLLTVGLVLSSAAAFAGTGVDESLGNLFGRERINLSGEWRYIVDPLQEGLATNESSRYIFAAEKRQEPGGALFEFDWDQQRVMQVPSDWNSAAPELELYQGMVWFRRTFDFFPDPDKRYFLYFEAADYHARVWFNGERVGKHEGGFTPFAFEITNRFSESNRNAVTVAVDNTHTALTLPEVAYDWWNYGGITRPVWMVEVPKTFIHSYFIRLADDGQSIAVDLRLDGSKAVGAEVTVSIPELALEEEAKTGSGGTASFTLAPDHLERWSTSNPKLYRVVVTSPLDTIEEEIGFRTVEVRGRDILVNGEPTFLRGISIHEESLGPVGTRKMDWTQAESLLRLAKEELGCNFVRLAHYPHSERMTRAADKLGLLVWSEVPVYQEIAVTHPSTRELAVGMISENVLRDRNRASIIVWSVANETPINDARNAFLGEMIDRVRELDPTRLVSAALDRTRKEGDVIIVDDPLGEHLDILAVNEYEGWYGDRHIDHITDIRWETPYEKPMMFSEFGAGAKAGHHGPRHERWTEEYQEYFYRQTLEMAENIPFLRGASPWILKDFRSPRRFHPLYQDFWNRKGLVSESGAKKLAFPVLSDWYARRAVDWQEVFVD